MSRRRLLAVGLSAVTAAVVAVAVDPHFERPGWFFYDSLQRLTAPAKAKGVTFVAISAASLQQMRESAENSYGWPWPRSLYGAFVRVAKHSGAASITFDGLFASPSTEGVEDDRAFGTAIKESGIAVAVGRAAGEHAEAVNGEISGAAAGAIREGIVSVPLEADGVFRRIPLTTQGHPTLGFATLASTPEFERRRSETMWPRFYADHGIPLVEASEMFRLFRAIDDGKPIEGEFAEIAAKLKGSHLIVGASAPGLQDLKPLPTEPNAPGALIHATALANWLSGLQVNRMTTVGEGLLIFVLGIFFFGFVFNAVRPMTALFGGIAIAVFGTLLMSFVAWHFTYWINPMSSFMSWAGFGLVVLGWRFQREWKERERLARSVENSMSSHMVDMIRTGELQVSRFGERREITILFSDLSGFTSISEKLDAHDLVDLVNMYSDEVVELIFQHQGFLDKFIGDAVMALWGAPVNGQNDHAKKGLETAIGMAETVKRFNVKAHAKYGTGDLFRARVGLHTGTAIVGNIGSHARYNYTAIGDSVNLASRLEGIGKAYNCWLLISEEALSAAGAMGQKGYALVDVMAVKGRSTPTRIHTYAPEASEEEFAAYREGFSEYEAGRFADAIPKFQRAPNIPPAEALVSRCQNLLAGIGTKHFKNGVWHHDEK